MAQEYKLADQLSITEIDDELVLLKLDTGCYYGLNTVGAQIVHGLSQGNTIHQICLTIAENFQTSYQTAVTDVNELMTQLLEQQLVIPCQTG